MVLGRPSAGKSSLINAICGHHISIVSPVPQTTRNVIRGVYTEERGQIVFLDTPGVHRSDRKMNRRLRDVALEHIPDAEALVYLIDAARPTGDEERDIAATVAEADLPVVVGITKCDRTEATPDRVRAFLAETGITAPESPVEVVELAGLPEEMAGTRRGITSFLDALFRILPQGHPWYPAEFYTDQDPRFRIAEILREEAIRRTRQEVPHAIYVEVVDIEERDDAIWTRAFILVERESQQGIVVGKRGATITAIRTAAEAALAEIFPKRVRLSVQVKVRPKWRSDEAVLKRLIR